MQWVVSCGYSYVFRLKQLPLLHGTFLWCPREPGSECQLASPLGSCVTFPTSHWSGCMRDSGNWFHLWKEGAARSHCKGRAGDVGHFPGSLQQYPKREGFISVWPSDRRAWTSKELAAPKRAEAHLRRLGHRAFCKGTCWAPTGCPAALSFQPQADPSRVPPLGHSHSQHRSSEAPRRVWGGGGGVSSSFTHTL